MTAVGLQEEQFALRSFCGWRRRTVSPVCLWVGRSDWYSVLPQPSGQIMDSTGSPKEKTNGKRTTVSKKVVIEAAALPRARVPWVSPDASSHGRSVRCGTLDSPHSRHLCRGFVSSMVPTWDEPCSQHDALTDPRRLERVKDRQGLGGISNYYCIYSSIRIFDSIYSSNSIR
jgi:hypothetical protein